ncbi:MAG: hypothetical protein IPK19_23180 [Chloroflexi bacterium]|nr:hypothetical protein [Chloroflexota bacterium]
MGLLNETSGDLDVIARWLNDDTLVFIRYAHDPSASADASPSDRFLPPTLYTVNLEGETKEWMAIPSSTSAQPMLWPWITPRGRAAVNVDLRDAGPDQGLWADPVRRG